MVIYKTQRHRGTEDIFLSYKKIQRYLNSVFNTKTQRDKVFFLETKITSDLKVATKPCGRGRPPAPLIPRGGFALRTKNFVGFVKQL